MVSFVNAKIALTSFKLSCVLDPVNILDDKSSVRCYPQLEEEIIPKQVDREFRYTRGS